MGGGFWFRLPGGRREGGTGREMRRGFEVEGSWKSEMGRCEVEIC